MKIWSRRYGRRGLVGALLAVAALTLSSNGVMAGFTACSADPTVTLSNGVVVQMSADIQDDVANVKGVAYEFHVPVGTTVTNVQYDQYGSLETLSFYADQSAGSYYETTTVTDATSGWVGVTANATVTNVTCKKPARAVRGGTNMAIMVQFTCS